MYSTWQTSVAYLLDFYLLSKETGAWNISLCGCVIRQKIHFTKNMKCHLRDKNHLSHMLKSPWIIHKTLWNAFSYLIKGCQNWDLSVLVKSRIFYIENMYLKDFWFKNSLTFFNPVNLSPLSIIIELSLFHAFATCIAMFILLHKHVAKHCSFFFHY